jgi:hypothetical protein
MSDEERVQRYWEAALKGAQWILSQQNPDGSFSPIEEGVDAYYKIPYALAVTGYPRQAQRLIDWVMRAGALTPEGDLRGREVKAQSKWHSECYTYSNSWMVIGAQRLGRFDYARRGIAFIRKFISAANGGVFSEPAFAWAGRGRQDMVVSSQAGSACLYMGLWDEAMRIGDWFVDMLRRQPDLQHALYACSDPAIGLITDYPADYPLMYVVKTDTKGQWYFYPGIAMGFLSKLYLATGKREYLDASAGYFDFTPQCREDVYCSGPSGKVGWGQRSDVLDYRRREIPPRGHCRGRLYAAHAISQRRMGLGRALSFRPFDAARHHCRVRRVVRRDRPASGPALKRAARRDESCASSV